jgi:hypothetical protein
VESADWIRTQLSGFSCSACGRPDRPSQIRVLAQREELFFVRLSCRGCGSHSVAIVTVQVDEDDSSTVEVGELEEVEQGGQPVTSDDVLEMHEFLRGFDGDFRSLFGERPKAPGPGGS